jgi:putative tryptophan/tyrosine transport system substrate-binding protein
MRRRDFIGAIGGAAAAWPLAARAQQRAVPVVGCLNGGTESAFGPQAAAFRQGLAEQGYVDGRNVQILYRWAELHYDRLPELAADLVRRGVAVIVASMDGTVSALAARSATSTLPIVFVTGGDPVERGLVASLNRPGGNLTGVYFLTGTLIGKRLELLHEIAPAITSIGNLVNPALPTFANEGVIKETEAAARALGVRVVFQDANTPSEIEAAFAVLVRRGIGGFIAAEALYFEQRDQLVRLAAHHAVPAIYAWREAVDAGGLMSYGTSLSDAFRLAGTYAARILKGDKPSDLPVQQTTKVELIINIKTAKALGLTIPVTLLATADEVIE